MNPRDTTSAEFFDAKYRAAADPWNFATDSYEQQRYRTIIRTLDGQRYRRAWEPGCSVGVLTEHLAALCERVDACDLSPAAVEQARARCAAWPGVQVRCASLTDAVDVANYDLLVLSEVGYYLHSDDWVAFLSKTVAAMQPGASLLASHWLGSSPDHILTGDEVHEALMKCAGLRLQHSERHEDAEHGGFRLDLWKRSEDECA